MQKNMKDSGRWSVKGRRRALLAGAYALLGAGAALGAAGGGGAATRPMATPTAAAAAKAQYAKAKDLYDAGKYAEAQAENEKAVALDPNNIDATLMKRVLEGKLSGGAGGSSTGAGGKPQQLTTTQISLIRIAEMTDNDSNLKGKIDRPVLEEFWNEVYVKDPLAGDISKQVHDAFLNPVNFPGQLHVFKNAKQQKYLEKVTVTSDPVMLAAFKTGVHPYAMQNCATSECHGGEKGGTFRLLPAAGAASNEVMYTNFYIMSMYGNKDGKMLDRDAPEKSLLLQYSLPWNVAALKHPKQDVRKIPNTGDNRYRGILEWTKALVLPRPDYGITYELPGAAK